MGQERLGPSYFFIPLVLGHSTSNILGLLPPHAAVILLKAAIAALAHRIAVKALHLACDKLEQCVCSIRLSKLNFFFKKSMKMTEKNVHRGVEEAGVFVCLRSVCGGGTRCRRRCRRFTVPQ